MSNKSHSIVTIELIEPGSELKGHSRHGGWQNTLHLWSVYLQPYFSISGKRLPRRIISSMAPPMLFPEFRRVYSDLKGPVLILTTLAFIVFYGIYDMDHGMLFTLFTCLKLTFGYWFIFSSLAISLGYFCHTCLSPAQFLSISGYSFTGHCLVLLMAEVFAQEEAHGVFIMFLTILGGLATGRLCIIMLARTPGPAQRLIMCSTLAIVHILHLVYLHFACMRRQLEM